MTRWVSVAVFGLLACGGQGINSGAPANGSDAPIRFTAIQPNGMVDLDREHDRDEARSFTFQVAVVGFNLASPGRCKGQANCGHLVLFIDGTTCGKPNSVSGSHHIQAHFGRCPNIAGNHVLLLELHDDADRVLGAAQPLTVRVNFTAVQNLGPPTLVIVSPVDGQKIRFEHEGERHHGDDKFTVLVALSNAILAPPGQCGGNPSCGHLVLLIDGNDCGQPNASSDRTDFAGFFGRCRVVHGDHSLVALLVNDNGRILATSPAVVVRVRLGDDEHDHDDDD